MARFEDWTHCRRMAIMTKTVVKEQVCYLCARPATHTIGHDSAVLIDFCRQHLHQRFVCLKLTKVTTNSDTLSQRIYVTVTDTVAGQSTSVTVRLNIRDVVTVGAVNVGVAVFAPVSDTGVPDVYTHEYDTIYHHLVNSFLYR